MPERLDKNGPAGLAVKVQCQHGDCRHSRVIIGAEADRLGERLWAYNRNTGKMHIRELIAAQACQKCGRRLTSLHFKLHYHGHTMRPRQHHDLAQAIPTVNLR